MMSTKVDLKGKGDLKRLFSYESPGNIESDELLMLFLAQSCKNPAIGQFSYHLIPMDGAKIFLDYLLWIQLFN